VLCNLSLLGLGSRWSPVVQMGGQAAYYLFNTGPQATPKLFIFLLGRKSAIFLNFPVWITCMQAVRRGAKASFPDFKIPRTCRSVICVK
jgi:hypothetical protein